MRVQVRQVARALGLDVVGFNSLLQHAPQLNLVTRDSDLRRASAAELVAIVQMAAHFGASVIVVGSPRQRRAPDDATFRRGRRTLHRRTPARRRRGRPPQNITLCLEPLTASLTNFMNDTREGVAVARAMDHPAVKLVLDVKQISQETRTFEAAVDLALPWLAHVHVNDANMHAPGEGDTDFTPIIRKLRAVGCWRSPWAVQRHEAEPLSATACTAMPWVRNQVSSRKARASLPVTGPHLEAFTWCQPLALDAPSDPASWCPGAATRPAAVVLPRSIAAYLAENPRRGLVLRPARLAPYRQGPRRTAHTPHTGHMHSRRRCSL